MDIPRSPKNLNIMINKDAKNSSEKTHQFHPNMKFNHNNISYYIHPECDSIKRERMMNAFDVLSNEVGLIEFYLSPENPDIEVICSEEKEYEPSSEKDFFIAGEGGAKEIVQTGKYNVITNGLISLYKFPSNAIKCKSSNIELHELIHVFGFGHSDNEDSLMNPHLGSCEQKLEELIINELKRLYSEENLPDLYFENANAVKKGRYLDFNLTIKNSGTIDAKDVTFSILDDGELVETRELKDLNYGTGIAIKIEYLKLIHLNPKKITFVIDMENKIREFNKKNNIAEINLVVSKK